MVDGVVVARPAAAAKLGHAGETSQEVLRRSRGNELFIAVVGPVGAGAGRAAKIIKQFLEEAGASRHEVHVVKASSAIKAWGRAEGRAIAGDGARKTLEGIVDMQDHGDAMRLATRDNAAVARAVVGEIRAVRAKASGQPEGELDGRPRAYIIDSLRHPAEAHLLRRLYQDAFTLVGVVCDPEKRSRRLRTELYSLDDRQTQATKAAISAFMDRDADAPEKHGQHVVDTFHEADFFVDNSKDAEDDPNNTAMNEPLRRLVRLLTLSEVIRPNVAETAMHQAHSAQLKSACLSRQVGAALVDAQGNVVATGTNEVPKAGGGVYGEAFEPGDDERCAFRPDRYCSSNREQNAIIDALLVAYPMLLAGRERSVVVAELRRTRLGGLIEFSRAVHAEMDAILSAARTGVSPRGTRLFVSAFPCHYCARHIVSAGIDEVQYIEPYPKSRALDLHCDAITTVSEDWEPPSRFRHESPRERAAPREAAKPRPKVLFRPFVGVAPRMYARVFLKDRDYKDKVTGNFAMGEPDWGGPSDLFKLRYTDLERDLGIRPA
ncbi:tRNA-specific adenosine deaminase [Methylobacterium cerastii]|uniref:tRNA-specific adenosine deaminase n=3 Tax=Methylobacterium TaxID=407 RepID=A0ABQ4U7F7_9HYPH|nr:MULTISPECIES: anti-phage dCTP deaminase [unclassified Methylobacterium]TXM79416.1 deoxycytidylate deaminase [Methylobacterium sp. WL69]TXN25509.1 deoxycytidylate deaminase [Methylobacterium sp. WL19]GJD42353.1 tRNA-specific adenosine deaminase [Methylobacterium cerastii]GJE62303.1 tRNA-specific adenosine deaminase [Methylobacterium trifolii]